MKNTVSFIVVAICCCFITVASAGWLGSGGESKPTMDPLLLNAIREAVRDGVREGVRETLLLVDGAQWPSFGSPTPSCVQVCSNITATSIGTSNVNVVNQPTVDLDATDSGYLDDIQSNTFASSQDLNEVKTGSQKFFICAYNPGSPGTCANTANGHIPVDVDNFPATQNVNGTVSVAGEVAVNLNANNQTVPVSGTVAVSNLPAQQHVIIDPDIFGYIVTAEYLSDSYPNGITVSNVAASGTFATTLVYPNKYIFQVTGPIVHCGTTTVNGVCGAVLNTTTYFHLKYVLIAYCNGTAPPATFSGPSDQNYFIINFSSLGPTTATGAAGILQFTVISGTAIQGSSTFQPPNGATCHLQANMVDSGNGGAGYPWVWLDAAITLLVKT